MKKVMIEINGKTHGPCNLDVTTNTQSVCIEGVRTYTDWLRKLGATITEHKEPLEWSGEVLCVDEAKFLASERAPFSGHQGKRFTCKLVEIVEGSGEL